MKTLITLLITISMSTMVAQAQCGIEKTYDEFEKTTTTTTDDFTITNTPLAFIFNKLSWKITLSFFKVDSVYNVYLSHQGNVTSGIKYIYFKFTDGEQIKKTEPQLYKLNSDVIGRGESRGTSFEITKQELQKFTTTEVEKIRFEFDEFSDQQVVEKGMNKTQKKNFLKYSMCLQNETN